MGYAFSLSTKGYITFGSCMRQLFEGRRVLFIASGDLSHRLLPDAPAGYHPDAKRFDLKLVEAVKDWSLDKYLLLEDFRDQFGIADQPELHSWDSTEEWAECLLI